MIKKLSALLSIGFLVWLSGCGQGEQATIVPGGYSTLSSPRSVSTITGVGGIVQNSTYSNGKMIRYEIDVVGADAGVLTGPEYIETWNYDPANGQLAKRTVDGIDLREFYNLSQTDIGSIDSDLLNLANGSPDFIEQWSYDTKGKKLAHAISGNVLTDNVVKAQAGGIIDYSFPAGALTGDTAQELPDFVELFWYSNNTKIATKQLYLNESHTNYSEVQSLVLSEVAAVNYDETNDLGIQPEPSFFTVFFDANLPIKEWFTAYPGVYAAPFIESYFESTPAESAYNAVYNVGLPLEPFIYSDQDGVQGYDSNVDLLITNISGDAFAQLTSFWLAEVQSLLSGMVVKNYGQGDQFYNIDLELKSQDAWGVRLVANKGPDGVADELLEYKLANPGHRPDIVEHFMNPDLDLLDIDSENNPDSVLLSVEANGFLIYQLSANTVSGELQQKQSHLYSPYEVITGSGPQTIWREERSELYSFKDLNPPARFISAPTVLAANQPGYPEALQVSQPVTYGTEVIYSYDSQTADLQSEQTTVYEFYKDSILDKRNQAFYPELVDLLNPQNTPQAMDPNIEPADFMIKVLSRIITTNHLLSMTTIEHQDDIAGTFLTDPGLDVFREEFKNIDGDLTSLRIDYGIDGSYEHTELRQYNVFGNLELIDIMADFGSGMENRVSDWDFVYFPGVNVLQSVDYTLHIDNVLKSSGQETYSPSGKKLLDSKDSDGNGRNNVLEERVYDPVTDLLVSYNKTQAFKSKVNGVMGEVDVVTRETSITYHNTDPTLKANYVDMQYRSKYVNNGAGDFTYEQQLKSMSDIQYDLNGAKIRYYYQDVDRNREKETFWTYYQPGSPFFGKVYEMRIDGGAEFGEDVDGSIDYMERYFYTYITQTQKYPLIKREIENGADSPIDDEAADKAEYWEYDLAGKILAHWLDDDPNTPPLDPALTFDIASVTPKSDIELANRQPGDDESLWHYTGTEFFEEWEYGQNGELINHKIDEDGDGVFDIFERADWF